MVILFSKQKKKELYLLILAIVLILGLIIFWIVYLNRDESTDVAVGNLDVSEVKEEKITIDFELLENELLKSLSSFEFIAPTSTEGFGRSNPFEPVVVSTSSTSTVSEF